MESWRAQPVVFWMFLLPGGQLRTFFSILVPLARPASPPASSRCSFRPWAQFKDANDWPLGAAMSFILMSLAFAVLAVRALLTQRRL